MTIAALLGIVAIVCGVLILLAAAELHVLAGVGLIVLGIAACIGDRGRIG